MKKEVTKKKVNYALRKQIRRTTATVLLLTSIIIASIPVPDVAAEDPTDEVTTSTKTTIKAIEYLEGHKIQDDMDATESYYNQPADGVSTYKAKEIAESGGTYEMKQAFSIYLKGDDDNKRGVIYDFNKNYIPTGGVLVIPDKVTVGYVEFTETDVIDYFKDLKEDQEKELNKFFGISWDDSIENENGTLGAYTSDDYYKKTGDIWISKISQTEISFENKQKYYMDKKLGCSQSLAYEARLVIGAVEETGNVNVYVPWCPTEKWKSKDEYSINAIADYAFCNEDGTSKIATVSELELQIQDYIIAIGDSAFQNATALKQITIGGGVTSIGDRAFSGCTKLSNVIFNEGIANIGVESFYDCNALESVVLPGSLVNVGVGAFASCSKLSSVDMSGASGDNTIVSDFAFYGCPNLKTVSFADGTKAIGTGCFAVVGAQNSLVDIVLPQNSAGIVELGDHIFDGQSMLEKVTMPRFYGTYNNEVKLDSGFFRGCINLIEVIFSEEAQFVTFDTDAFQDVATAEFKIIGPATKTGGDMADPRTSAHAANVPYQYVENGVTYLELKKGDNFYRINDQGQLISFESDSDKVDLEIFDKIGNFPIIGIATDCFDENTKAKLKTVTIYDNSISSIADNTFSNCDNLEMVYIGDSVQTIGANAFSDCDILNDVTIGEGVTTIGNSAFEECPKIRKIEFISPKADYSAMVIGADAFKTGSDELVLIGDISSEYAPFNWAMSKESILDDASGKRVCYKSPAPSNLTVLYDNNTGLATLVDYPHFSNIDSDNKEYKDRLVADYTKMIRGADNILDKDAEINAMSKLVYGKHYIQNKILTSEGRKTIDDPDWTEGLNKSYYEVSVEETRLYDAICNIVVPAGVQSIDVRQYVGKEFNQKVPNNTVNFEYITSGYLGKYQAGPGEKSVSNSARSSEGITILDMHTLVASATPSYTVVQDVFENVPGGLFSGYFQDYPGDSVSEDEKTMIGNDRLKSVTMTDVQSLPDYAFAGCENLESVILGPALKQMGTAPFLGTPDLINFAGNDNFVVENKMVYAKDQTGTSDALTLVQCLPSRGLTSGVEKEVSVLTDPLLANVSTLQDEAFIDCDGMHTVDLSNSTSINTIPENAFYDSRITTVKLPTSVGMIKKGAFKTEVPVTVTIPTKNTSIETDAFNEGKIITYADTPAYNYAMDNDMLTVGLLGELYEITFMGYEGEIIEVQEVESGSNAYPPTVTPPSGYVFKEWKGDYMNVTEDRIVTAIFMAESDSSGGGSTGGGSTGGGSTGGGSTGGGSGDGSNGNGSASGNSTEAVYKVTVVSGSGSGDYKAGDIVNITANASSTGLLFDKWTTASSGVYMSNSDNVTTSFVMPKAAVTVTANYKTSTGETVKPDSSDKDDDDDSKSSTVITITKPGFSDKDKANAYVNGSADNFVVKITESAIAQELLQKAFIKKMNSLDTLKFFPMDISLYDSTGTVLVTDSAGISVTITIPIPDELRQYAGNNKVASEYNGNIETLDAKFTTIDGVPCVTFVAKHFSPYAIYVDTANLGSGSTQDQTPQTGDGIHPKWFLSIGFLASAIFLYMKKDKRAIIGEMPYEAT